MRKPKGKLVALLAGAGVVVLMVVGVWFWRDFYCHLFLDHRLVLLQFYASDRDEQR